MSTTVGSVKFGSVGAVIGGPRVEHAGRALTPLSDVLACNGGDLSAADLAALADWASDKAKVAPSREWYRAYSLIREGADTLLRRMARDGVR